MLGGDRPPSPRVLLGLGIVTACTLGFQVIFTRLISAVMAYHFSFLAVSLALLGTGAGSLLIYVRPAWFDGRPLEVNLARWAAAYGVLLLVCPFGLVQLNYSVDRGITFGFVATLTTVCLLAAAPSLAAGAVVALAIRGYTRHVGRVYAWDLVGAGLGALAVVPLLRIPAPLLLLGLGLLALTAAGLFAWGTGFTTRIVAGLGVAGIGVLVAASLTSLLYLPSGYEIQNGKVADEWHPLSRVQGYTAGGGIGLMFYDRVYAPVPSTPGGKLPTWREMSLGPASIGYQLTGPGHTLVIGGGGGRDIYNALTSDQTVDVIELNSAIRDVVDKDLGRLSGSPYSREGVSTSIGDGRAILASRDTKYDTIHIGFTDTLSANSAQGFALTENNLYTMEAFEEYLDHLRPGGILNVSRLERLVGDEAIRVTVLTLAALEHHGVKDPLKNIVVIRGSDTAAAIQAPYATVLARLTPFTSEEVAQVEKLANERGAGLAYAPGRSPSYGEWDHLAKTDWRTFCHDYALNVCPPTDDKPFFFNMRRTTDVVGDNEAYTYGVDPYQLLLVTLGILTLLSVLGFLLPLWLARTGTERPRIPSLFYFAAIGMGFLMLETVLIQRFVLFLGFPTYALSVVLFALLIFTGVGSAISGRLPHTRRTLTTVLAVAVGLIVVSAFTLQPLVGALIDRPFAMRVVLTVLLLAPTGLLLGMPMPIGLTRFSALHPSGVPYAWGVNGIASVLASVLAITVALNFGYVVASLCAATCYCFALGHARLGRWAQPDADEPPESDAVLVESSSSAADHGSSVPAATASAS